MHCGRCYAVTAVSVQLFNIRIIWFRSLSSFFLGQNVTNSKSFSPLNTLKGQFNQTVFLLLFPFFHLFWHNSCYRATLKNTNSSEHKVSWRWPEYHHQPIKSYRSNKEPFVVRAGPKEETAADYWRMIWEQKVATVVMLTNLKERKEVSHWLLFFFVRHWYCTIEFDSSFKLRTMSKLSRNGRTIFLLESYWNTVLETAVCHLGVGGGVWYSPAPPAGQRDPFLLCFQTLWLCKQVKWAAEQMEMWKSDTMTLNFSLNLSLSHLFSLKIKFLRLRLSALAEGSKLNRSIRWEFKSVGWMS